MSKKEKGDEKPTKDLNAQEKESVQQKEKSRVFQKAKFREKQPDREGA